MYGPNLRANQPNLGFNPILFFSAALESAGINSNNNKKRNEK